MRQPYLLSPISLGLSPSHYEILCRKAKGKLYLPVTAKLYNFSLQNPHLTDMPECSGTSRQHLISEALKCSNYKPCNNLYINVLQHTTQS